MRAINRERSYSKIVFSSDPHRSASQGDEHTQPPITQVQTCPNENSSQERSDEGRISQAHIRCNGAAKIARHQNGAQYRRARDQINDRAADLKYSNLENQMLRISVARHSLNHGWHL